jgi:diguanylate cyclase (GGDEF)-like protein
MIDKDTYEYYKIKKFSDYKELYRGVLPYEYCFYIRDVNKNTNMSKMFTYFVETVNYNSIKHKYDSNSNNYSSGSLLAFIITLLVIILLMGLIIIFKKKKKHETIVTNNDKLKYIDAMTSLKNRNYLNLKMKEWDNNTIYPQGFVVVDLNNIKYINDNHGHEEGDNVIKKAANILINNQIENTDIVRTDGNEFLVYMIGYEESSVQEYIRKLSKEMQALPYNFGAAIGYSMIVDDIKTIDDAINEATIAMRESKEKR